MCKINRKLPTGVASPTPAAPSMTATGGGPFTFFQQQYAPFFPPQQDPNYQFLLRQKQMQEEQMRMLSFQPTPANTTTTTTAPVQELFSFHQAIPNLVRNTTNIVSTTTASSMVEDVTRRFKFPKLEGGSDSEDASSASGSESFDQQQQVVNNTNNNCHVEKEAMSSSSSSSSSLKKKNNNNQQQQQQLKKKTTKSSTSKSNTDQSESGGLKKRKHEATLDGERRVAIEFDHLGNIGSIPQTYGKGKLIVPNGMSGKYSAFGQRWQFTVSHDERGPMECEDGLHRICMRWELTNLNSGVQHSVLETPSEALRRDRDGKTVCNRVFREALMLRTKALEEELLQCQKEETRRVEIETQLKTLNTKRFSEGPLFFGLRHACLQNEMKKQQQVISSSSSPSS